MAVTKIHSIKSNELAKLRYIADPEKTDGGRLISTNVCSYNPLQAHQNFADIRKTGTGRNTILSQHFIQSFKPGEITADEALLIGDELCHRFLKDEYQYFLAVHQDKEHIHVHVIFNNINMFNHKTFETNENQGGKRFRAWKKLRDASDQLCREHNLSVIETDSDAEAFDFKNTETFGGYENED